jgi:dTDP-L-rhamnose 4-epimerase
MRVLVIGGAGFIGSHLVDSLLAKGYAVRVFDNLDPQVHAAGQVPKYLNPDAEFVRGDLRDLDALRRSLDGIQGVFYLAGAVGVGDSMYRIRDYVELNSLGAANFLEILANEKTPVQKVVAASSVTVYGEGKYSCPVHGVVFPKMRTPAQVEARDWELHCPAAMEGKGCSAPLTPLPTDEEKPASPQSIYAITKHGQEEMFLCVSRAYGIPIAVLRYFNAYGPRQALSNPYTGVVKIFASRLVQGRAPIIYEDGRQSRDFIHVSDLVRATVLAFERSEANDKILNVGTGKPTSILEVAAALAERLGYQGELQPKFQARAGDIRHCWADTTKIRRLLGFEPKHLFPSGVEDVLQWSGGADAAAPEEKAQIELEERGLIS